MQIDLESGIPMTLVPVSVLRNEYKQFAAAINQEINKPNVGPDDPDYSIWRQWTPEEWARLCKKTRDYLGGTSDVLEIADFMLTQLVPGGTDVTSTIGIKAASDELLRLKEQFKKQEIKTVDALDVLSNFDLEVAVHALISHYFPYSDHILLVGTEGSGKTCLGWKLVTAIDKMMAVIQATPGDSFGESVNRNMFIGGLGEYGKFLQKIKKEINPFGVFENIPSHLKRRNADMSKTIERIAIFAQEYLHDVSILPGQLKIRHGLLEPVYRTKKTLKDKLLFRKVGTKKKKLKDEKEVRLTARGKGDELIRIDENMKNAYMNYVLLVGNLVKSEGLVAGPIVDYSLSIHRNDALVKQIDIGGDYIRFMGEFRKFLADYQFEKTRVSEEYTESLAREDDEEFEDVETSIGILIDSVKSKVTKFVDRWGNQFNGLVSFLGEALDFDFFAEFIQKDQEKTFVGGVVISGQDERSEFMNKINKSIPKEVYPLMWKLTATPVSYVVPKVSRKDDEGNLLCVYPVNVKEIYIPEKERKENTYMGLGQFLLENYRERRKLRAHMSMDKRLLPTYEALSAFRSLSRRRLAKLFDEDFYNALDKDFLKSLMEKFKVKKPEDLRGKEGVPKPPLALIKSAFLEYLHKDSHEVFEKIIDYNMIKIRLSDLVRDSLVATNQFTYNKNEKSKITFTELDLFTEADAHELVRYEILRYFDDIEKNPEEIERYEKEHTKLEGDKKFDLDVWTQASGFLYKLFKTLRRYDQMGQLIKSSDNTCYFIPNPDKLLELFEEFKQSFSVPAKEASVPYSAEQQVPEQPVYTGPVATKPMIPTVKHDFSAMLEEPDIQQGVPTQAPTSTEPVSTPTVTPPAETQVETQTYTKEDYIKTIEDFFQLSA
jgi:hypothetical protein